jgi:DNA-binding IclR family transcriptional regulator
MRNDDTRRTSDTDDRSGEVGVLNKSLDLIEAMARNEARTVADLSAASGVNKAAAYRILTTLERRGYVVRGPSEVRRYLMGPAMRSLTQDASSPGDLLVLARPYMKQLWEEFDETVNLGMMSNKQVLYLDILESGQGLRTTVSVGTHDDLHSTALGKAMLAALPPPKAEAMLASKCLTARTPHTLTSIPDLMQELEIIRERGYALDDEENEPGARCIAAAIMEPRGRVLGAHSVSGPTWRINDRKVNRIGRRLNEMSDEISAQLG